MNWEQVKGQWKQFTGAAKDRWGKLTDDDIKRIDGRRDELEGILQERYGVAKEDANRQIDEFCANLKAAS